MAGASHRKSSFLFRNQRESLYFPRNQSAQGLKSTKIFFANQKPRRAGFFVSQGLISSIGGQAPLAEKNRLEYAY